MTEAIDQGGEAPCWSHLVDDLDGHLDNRLDDASDQAVAPLQPVASNTIIYCDEWAVVVDFYRSGLGLRATMERDWFIEFDLHPGAHLSVADASRATVAAGDGSGLTLSWRVDDVAAARARVVGRGIDASPIRRRWDADTCFVFDPAGNRIEFWAPVDEAH